MMSLQNFDDLLSYEKYLLITLFACTRFEIVMIMVNFSSNTHQFEKVLEAIVGVLADPFFRFQLKKQNYA